MFSHQLEQNATAIQQHLDEVSHYDDVNVVQAMRHSLSGGKGFAPFLL